MMSVRRGHRVLSLLASAALCLVRWANAQTVTDTMTFGRQGVILSFSWTGRGPPVVCHMAMGNDRKFYPQP